MLVTARVSCPRWHHDDDDDTDDNDNDDDDDDDDDQVMMMPDGRLYLSTAAKAGAGQTRATLADCEGVCSALFGETLSLGGDGWVHLQ